jgi:hypothetical protein
MGHSSESSGVSRSLHPFSLPRALNDSFPPRVFVGRMSQSGRSEPLAEGAAIGGASRPIDDGDERPQLGVKPFHVRTQGCPTRQCLHRRTEVVYARGSDRATGSRCAA